MRARCQLANSGVKDCATPTGGKNEGGAQLTLRGREDLVKIGRAGESARAMVDENGNEASQGLLGEYSASDTCGPGRTSFLRFEICCSSRRCCSSASLLGTKCQAGRRPDRQIDARPRDPEPAQGPRDGRSARQEARAASRTECRPCNLQTRGLARTHTGASWQRGRTHAIPTRRARRPSVRLASASLKRLGDWPSCKRSESSRLGQTGTSLGQHLLLCKACSYERKQE
jgi:hypothetical protein